MSSGVVWWYLRVSQVFFGLWKGRATSWTGRRLEGQQVLCYLLCMLLQFFHVQNTIKDKPLQLPEGHTNINTWGTLVDDWWTFSLICFNSHRSGSKWLFSSSFFSSLCSSFASKKLLSKDRRPSKSRDSSWRRVLSDEYLSMALNSFG